VIHIINQYWIKSKKSNIPDAQMGLYTVRDRMPNRPVVEYDGEKLNHDNINSKYVLQVGANDFIKYNELIALKLYQS